MSGARALPVPLAAALHALRGPFVVADLETTGLSTASCEILEIAAARVQADGVCEREYAQVVRTGAGCRRSSAN